RQKGGCKGNLTGSIRGENENPERARGRFRLLARTAVFANPPVFSVFFSFFLSFRSCLPGLHFSQDFPSLCAATQHLCVHCLPWADAFSQHVLSPAKAGPARNTPEQIIATISFMVFIASSLRYWIQ